MSFAGAPRFFVTLPVLQAESIVTTGRKTTSKTTGKTTKSWVV
jgi:hypothetical protein